MSEGQPERVRVWSLEHARDIIGLQLRIIPGLLDEFARLCGGKAGLINPILDRVADGISYDPYSEMTLEAFRRLAGVPEDPAQLEPWRKAVYDDYQAAHTTDHIVRP